MTWWTLSLLSQGALAIYTQVVEWVDLFPWNDLSHGNGQETADVALGITQAGLIYGTWRRSRRVLATAPALYGLWLAAQVATWWQGYLVAPNPDAVPRVYQRYFSRTYRFLPPRGNRIVPDANHVVLQIGIVVTLVCTLQAWRENRLCPRACKCRPL